MPRGLVWKLSAGVAVCALTSAAAGPAFAQTGDVGDPASTRRVYLVIAGLVVLAGLLTAFTVWFWRSTRPESTSLGRLEAMGLRRWDRADYTQRLQQLDDVGEFEGGDGPLLDPDATEPAEEPDAASLAELVELADLVDATPEPAPLPGEPAVLPGEPLI